jgi:hypothetical protein
MDTKEFIGLKMSKDYCNAYSLNLVLLLRSLSMIYNPPVPYASEALNMTFSFYSSASPNSARPALECR